ncbi:hypothetical protein E2N92_13265 [Methanofollis formosanus]|uniref:DUF3821 domain-containing protein n=1 Tax=Methanofollis formosanus TaxID=299308 RepID=A0A8G1A2U1_9EURY|nr:hypothetical protein [Methanofollis formosanus]QYZ80329.1 hypothetical protein E2N92_13265 [Methanofollis formosanus]
MNSYRNAVLLCIFFIAAGTLVPAVSARFATSEGPNAGIGNGDTVFLGERNVNFSAFADPAKGELRQMVRIEDGEPTDPIQIADFVATSIPRGIAVNARYYPVYYDPATGTFTDPDTGTFCWVQDAGAYLGDLKVRVYDIDITPTPALARPETIPYTMGVQFLLPENTLPVTEFNGPWYEYELKGTVKTTEVVNLDGEHLSLEDLSGNPAEENRRFAFTFADQDAVDRDSRATMTFRMTLNDLDYERSWTFNVQDYSLALQLADTSTERGKDLGLTLHGVPFTQYVLSLEKAPDYPFFSGGGWDSKVSDFKITAHPGWDGTAALRIEIPRAAPLTTYAVQAKDPDTADQPVSATFIVAAPSGSTSDLVFENPELDDYSYALGDMIKLHGWCKNVKEKIPIYLYATGPNLHENGAPLTDPTREVVDGDTSTFTVTYYDPFFNRWDYQWWTHYYARAGCEGETYTVHANFDPIGYIYSAPDGAGSFEGDAPPAWEIALNEPTINAKFDERSGSVFAQGDRLYSWWHARGSPGLTGIAATHGHLKWYIFGNNFRYADYDAHFPIYEGSSSSGSLLDDNGQGDLPIGVYGFDYARNFTYDLTPGEYYIVYQHPGRNNQFDLLPENNPYFRGRVNEVVDATNKVPSARVGSLEAREAAQALTDALDSPYVDDIYVMDTFTVEKPRITISSPGDVAVGEKLTVKGTTNLAGENKAADDVEVGDELALTVSRLDLDAGHKGNAAMKFKTIYTYPSTKPDPATGKRTFVFEDVETASWYPGQYLITVECKDARYKQTLSFELLGEGVRRDTTATDPAHDPALSENPSHPAASSTLSWEEEDEEWPTPYQTTVPTTTPQQSAGLLPVAACAFLLAALIPPRRW